MLDNIKQYLKNHEKRNGRYAINIRWNSLGIDPSDYDDGVESEAWKRLRKFQDKFNNETRIMLLVTGRSDGWLELLYPTYDSRYDNDEDLLEIFKLVSKFDIDFNQELISFKTWLENEA